MLKPLLQQALAENALALNDNAIDALVHYLELMQTWNRAFNLTAITDPRDMVYLHLIDSLTLLPYLQGQRALDVGSGAGLPGIPLAIVHPEITWVLLDKNSKKTRFLTQVSAELGLKNITAVHSRCEDFQPPLAFDIITSRAYGSLQLFVESTEHLLAPQGCFLAMKGKYPNDELAQLPSRFIQQNVTRLAINGVDAERHLVQIKINR